MTYSVSFICYIFVNSILVSDKESAKKQREIEKQQEIITTMMLQLQERDEQIEELKQSLKGNYYSMYM